MHEFVECSKLRVFSVRIKEMIGRCWNERLKELWLFGVNGE